MTDEENREQSEAILTSFGAVAAALLEREDGSKHNFVTLYYSGKYEKFQITISREGAMTPEGKFYKLKKDIKALLDTEHYMSGTQVLETLKTIYYNDGDYEVPHPYENWELFGSFVIDATEKYDIDDHDLVTFTRIWREGCWQELDKEWPEWVDYVKKFRKKG